MTQQYWNTWLLKTPLYTNNQWDLKYCMDNKLPCAVFRKARKYGEYECDLYHLTHGGGFYLTKEGCHEIVGVFKAFFSRWLIDKRLPKGKNSVAYSEGPSNISIAPCPVGEEVYIHHAVCRILAEHLRLVEE